MTKYFGTDGVRGRVDEKLTVEMAYRIGRFIGQYPMANAIASSSLAIREYPVKNCWTP
jgi:phosphomannomutase